MPLKPCCAVIEIEPVVPVLPALISGKAMGSLRVKLGLDVTLRVNDVLKAEGAPAVVAWSVTG